MIYAAAGLCLLAIAAAVYAVVTSPTLCTCCNARWAKKGSAFCQACIEHGKPS